MNTVTDRRSSLDRRWLALALSLVCNVFLAAVIAGHFLGPRVRPVRFSIGSAPMTRALQRAEGILSPKDAAAFRAVLERDRPRYAPAARQVAEARRALELQIAAQPFDPRAASQALAAWRASWNGFVDDFSGPLIDALAAISPEGRSRLVASRRAREQHGDPDSP
ncbi:MAG TPA: periplasmic heavy metal sensor [Steroidobacteraceae bacterium]|nr:periplasmic heavy metal sensor [Steroidobacteraceae bacterium]